MRSLLTRTVARLMLGPILVVSMAVLVKGYVDVGDGFAAGMIAALGVLLQYMAFGPSEVERALPIRALPMLVPIGLLGALGIAAIPLARGEPLLTHVPASGAEVSKLGTLELITAVGFDVMIFMIVLGAAVGIIHAIAAGWER